MRAYVLWVCNPIYENPTLRGVFASVDEAFANVSTNHPEWWYVEIWNGLNQLDEVEFTDWKKKEAT